ncbi:MAG: hypothetical protein AB2810_06935 [Candidatus Thiodiazotropha endolucinida]
MSNTCSNREVDQLRRDKIGCRYAMADGTGITRATASIAQLPKTASIIGHVFDNSSGRVCVVSHSFMRRSVIAYLEWSRHNAPEGDQVQ